MSVDLEQLTRRARAGDRVAFSALVERFEAPLFQFLNLRAPSREDAEELTQETFLRAWKFLDKYDPGRSFSTWLFTLGRHLAVSAYRKRKLRTAGPELLEGLVDSVQPGAILSGKEQDENLWKLARRALSKDQHTALWLRYGEDVETLEVARIMGKREATVRVILFRARTRLAHELQVEEDSKPTGPRTARAVSAVGPYPRTGPLEPEGSM